MPKHDTPMLDQLESGPWPSFVTDIKRQAEKNEACWDILGQLELSYKDKITHWKHGGIVGVFGYGGGIVGRYSDVAEKFPGQAFTDDDTLRMMQNPLFTAFHQWEAEDIEEMLICKQTAFIKTDIFLREEHAAYRSKSCRSPDFREFIHQHRRQSCG